MKNYNKNKKSSYIQYLDANDLYQWAMPQKLSIDRFKWVDDILVINKKTLKNYKSYKKLWWRKRWRIYSWSRYWIY